MKRLLIVILFLNAFQAKGQTFEGKVVDQKNGPIPFVTIGIIGKDVGTYSYEDGTFTLDLSRVSKNECITFRHLGYDEVCIAIKNLSQTIQLQASPIRLPDIVVKPGKRKLIGLRKRRPNTEVRIRTPFNGAEMATLLKVGPDSVIVDEISLGVQVENMTDALVRVKFYEDQNGTPGKELSDLSFESQLVKTKSVYYLYPKSPFILADNVFISFEWLVKRVEAQELMSLDYTTLERFIRVSEQYPNETINIVDENQIQVISSNGQLLKTVRLNDFDKAEIRRLEDGIPRFQFGLVNDRRPSFYRPFSLGKWYPVNGTIVAGISTLKY